MQTSTPTAAADQPAAAANADTPLWRVGQLIDEHYQRHVPAPTTLGALVLALGFDVLNSTREVEREVGSSLIRLGWTQGRQHDGNWQRMWIPPATLPADAAGQPATHPSRSAPKCGDCKHVFLSLDDEPRCNHPAAPVDPILHEPASNCRYMREDVWIEQTPPACGPAGSWFIQAEPARTPSSFQPATWRGTLPPDAHTGTQGISFGLSDGTVLRLLLAEKTVRDVLETLAPDYFSSMSVQRNHSDASALMSSDPKSVPSDGVNVGPPAASSTACTKEP